MTQRIEDRELDLMHRRSQAFQWLTARRSRLLHLHSILSDPNCDPLLECEQIQSLLSQHSKGTL